MAPLSHCDCPAIACTKEYAPICATGGTSAKIYSTLCQLSAITCNYTKSKLFSAGTNFIIILLIIYLMQISCQSINRFARIRRNCVRMRDNAGINTIPFVRKLATIASNWSTVRADCTRRIAMTQARVSFIAFPLQFFIFLALVLLRCIQRGQYKHVSYAGRFAVS